VLSIKTVRKYVYVEILEITHICVRIRPSGLVPTDTARRISPTTFLLSAPFLYHLPHRPIFIPNSPNFHSQQSSVALKPTASTLTAPRSTHLSYEDAAAPKSSAQPHSPFLLQHPTHPSAPPQSVLTFPHSTTNHTTIFIQSQILHLAPYDPIGPTITHKSLQNTSTNPHPLISLSRYQSNINSFIGKYIK